MNKQEIWKKILNIVITVLTAIATTFGVSSCMNLMQ
ncbi:MAG: smalltalk protein [Bacteroidaceae bacterium]|nr:smalltalk protein [Bacteroidaceae bacterium]